MTHPRVDDLPEEATSTLLGICEQLSLSRHAGLARWAASVSDALLLQLVSVTTGARVDVTDIEPCQPLARLDGAELEGLRAVLLAGADASDDESVVEWCTRVAGSLPPTSTAAHTRRPRSTLRSPSSKLRNGGLRTRRGQRSTFPAFGRGRGVYLPPD